MSVCRNVWFAGDVGDLRDLGNERDLRKPAPFPKEEGLQRAHTAPTSPGAPLALLASVALAAACLADDGAVRHLSYREHGAVGDGVADDFDAIVKTHAAANEAGLRVCADAGATYYIGGADQTAWIQTDTDWGDAAFIIDDTDVKNRNRHIFTLSSRLPSKPITTITALKKNQEKIDLSLASGAFVVVTDKTTLRYRREGANRNDGSAQTDVFIVDKDGNVDMRAPIIWDFDAVSSMVAYPIDAETLTVRGGRFTTIANQAESKYTYYARGINVTRSNVRVEDVHHLVTGEQDHGAPYGGFITVSGCAGVIVQNCVLSGHKTYSTIGAANTPVSMGSYDVSVNKSINVTFKDCKQANDIHDGRLWGIFGSNYSKNLTFDTVAFSRFDAHMGVVNATIRNSVLGHMSVNIIGSGLFLIENTKVCGANFLNLRPDYGSTWEGDIIIRNCEYVPRNGAKSDAVLISGSHSGKHDFGYPCHMPGKITVDGLVIHDTNPPDGYRGPKLFAPFNPAHKDETYTETYPYVITREVVIRNLTTKSGKPYIISTNPFLFRNVKVTEPERAF